MTDDLVKLLGALTTHPEAVVRHTASNAQDRIEALTAENELLRAALSKIAAECWVTVGTDAQMYSRWRKLAVERVDIARAALAKSMKGPTDEA